MNVVCNWKNCIHPFYNTLIAFDGFSGYDIIIHCEIGILRLLAVRNQTFLFYLFIYLISYLIKCSWKIAEIMNFEIAL